MHELTADEMAASLSLLLHQKLGIKGGGLEAKVARAGRLLPRRIRRHAAVVIEAERVSGSPKLARLVDEAMLHKSYAEVERFLNEIDVGERRKTRAINFLGLLSLNLLVVAGLLLAYLVWQGYL